MKKSTLALSALTLALAAGLSACGGGTSSHTVTGVVTGLEHDGLVLSNNGEDLAIAKAGYDEVTDPVTKVVTLVPKNVNYAFNNRLDYGDPYDVTVKTQPAHQRCVQNGGTTDTAGRLSAINAIISCQLVRNTIGGKVIGLKGDNLVLTNGSTGGTVAVAKDPAKLTTGVPFEFAQPVVYGQTFGVTVLTQPGGQTCTVANGAGEMRDDKIETIIVTCSDNA